MRIRSLVGVVFAVGAAACGGTDDTTTADTTAATADTGALAPGSAAGTRASLADASTAAQIDSAVTAAQRGLTSLAPSAAITLIRSLEEKLDNSNDPELTDIATDLEKLREELDDDTIDGEDVGEILKRLGPKVTKAAPKAGDASSQLTRLGQSLAQQGQKLDP
jgi:hypothetical protein